jgi:hypothetical protein
MRAKDGNGRKAARVPDQMPAAPLAAATSSPRRIGVSHRERRSAGSSASGIRPVADDRASSAKATSLALWKRSSGSFSRQRRAIRSSAGGSGPTGETSSGGSSLRIAARVSARVGRRNGGRPESISNSTAPSAKMSDRASEDAPRTCSGDM